MTTDLLERIREANPVPVDPPGRPIDSLLETLDPEPHPRAARRLRARPLLAVLAVVVIAVAVVLELRPGSHSVDVAAAFERATALPAHGVLHVKWEMYQPASDGHPAMTARHEFWIDASHDRTRSIDSFGTGDRKLRFERTSDSRHTRTWSSTDPHRIVVGTQSRRDAENIIRALLAAVGDLRRSPLRLVGREQHAGRSLWHLTTTLNSPHVRVDALADPRTHVPVEMRFRRVRRSGALGRTMQINTYLVYERLPDNAHTRALLSMSPH